MSTDPTIVVTKLHLVGLDGVSKKWGWLCALGILLIVLGTVAVGASVFVTLATMVFVGGLMVVGGLLQTAYAISMRGWSGFYLDLMAGILSTVIGLLIIAHPGATAVALTLMIAIFLIMNGSFRIVAGLSVPYQNRLWLVLHGILNLLLAFVILSNWPVSGLWIIGLFIGVDMIFNGWSLIMLGLVAKKLTSV